MLFGAAYYPEHRDPAKWDYDLDMMAEIRVNALRVGEFAWKRFEPSDGHYDFKWMDTFLAKAARRGIRLLLCPPLRTVPAWLVERDSSILIEDDSGMRLEFGSRYTFCINHPLFREKGLALAERLAQHYGHNDHVAGWHLDNEFGDEQDCHCPVCREKFQKWIETRYGTIAKLNFVWGMVFWGLEFDHFGQVPTPRRTKVMHSPSLQQAWRQFRSDCTVEMVRLHAAAVRRHAGARQFVTTNNQCLWNPRTDYYEMQKHLDVCGTNYYPHYGENCRDAAFGLANVRGYKGKNFQVHELRCGPHGIAGAPGNTPAPGEVERLAMHTIANGADGIFFFRWRSCPFGLEQPHGGITDYDGRPTAIYEECRRLSENLSRIRGLLVDTEVRSDVAIFYDFQSRWMTETRSPWEGPAGLYVERGKLMYRVLRGLGINVDSVGRHSDLTRYKLLVVPMLTPIDDALAKALRGYVEGGGMLVWQPLSGLKNMEGIIYPNRLHPVLEGMLGVDVRAYATHATATGHAFEWQGSRYACGLFLDLPKLTGAHVAARYVDAWFAGTAAVTENKLGAGRAFHVAAFAEERFYHDFLGALLGAVGVSRILDTTVPETVEVVERRAPDGRRLVFLLNCSGNSVAVPLPRPYEDVWHNETVRSEARLKPWGVRVLRG